MNPYMILPQLNKPAANDQVDDAISVYAYKAVNALAEWVANTVGAIRAWHTRHAAIDELSRLNDHLLYDNGIDRSEIRAVVDGMLSRPPARKRSRRGTSHLAAKDGEPRTGSVPVSHSERTRATASARRSKPPRRPG